MEAVVWFLVALLLAVILPALLEALGPRRVEWLFPLKGRWLRYLAAALPVGVLALIAPWPVGATAVGASLLAAGWCRWRRSVLCGVEEYRYKSVDTGAGVLIIAETGGLPSSRLRAELELWQQAGLESLSQPGTGAVPR
jgi:hypothetical protein